MNERDSVAFWPLLKSEIVYNAGDPSLALLASQMKLLENAGDAPLWFNRAMQLAPGWALPHVQAASWLAARQHWDQAADELVVAQALDSRALDATLCNWMRARPDAQFAVHLAPTSGNARAETLDRASICLLSIDVGESIALDDRLLADNPLYPPAQLRRARRATDQGDFAEAIALARELRERAPDSAAAVDIEATALVRWGQPGQAVALLKSVLAHVDDERAVLLSLALAQASAKDPEGMRLSIDQLRLRSAGKPTLLVEVAVRQAQCEDLLGNYGRAMTAMLEAHRVSGDPNHLAAAAQFATRLGQLPFAAKAWSDLCAQFPTNGTYCTQRDQLLRAVSSQH